MEEEIIEEEDSGWWGGWERWGGNDFEEDEEEGAVKVVEKKRQRVGRRRLVEVEFTFIVKRSERKRWTGKHLVFFLFFDFLITLSFFCRCDP